MNPAYLLGAFLGSAAAVIILTLIIGAFIKSPLLPVVLATGAIIGLSIVGNDGLEPDSLVMYLLGGALTGTWRAIRRGQFTPAPRHTRASLDSSQVRRPVIHKLYLTAFWGLALVCGSTSLYHFLVSGHDYLVVERSIACLNRTNSIGACGLYRTTMSTGSAPRFDDLPGEEEWEDVDGLLARGGKLEGTTSLEGIISTKTWDRGSISRFEQNHRFMVALLSPLWLLPLALLAAVRLWVLWLIREEPQTYASGG